MGIPAVGTALLLYPQVISMRVSHIIYWEVFQWAWPVYWVTSGTAVNVKNAESYGTNNTTTSLNPEAVPQNAAYAASRVIHSINGQAANVKYVVK
jgi:hypothetical protein